MSVFLKLTMEYPISNLLKFNKIPKTLDDSYEYQESSFSRG